MAITFVGAGSIGSAAGPSAVATAGMPAGIQAGDVLVMLVGGSRGGASGSVQFSSSIDFETFTNRGTNNGTTNAALYWATKVYVPGDSGFSITLAAGELANTCAEVVILAFRGVDHASLAWQGGVSSGGTSTSGVASTTVSPPAAALHPTDGGMAIAVVSALGAVGPFTTPSGWSVGAKGTTTAAAIGNTLEAYYQNFAAGTTTSTTPAITGTTSTKTGHQIVLFPARPAESGTGARVRAAASNRARFSNPTMVVPKPVGTATGHLMIAAASLDNDGVLADLVPPDASWIPLANGSVTETGGAGYYGVWYKFATASEPTSYAWGKGTAGDGIIGIVSFSGAGAPSRLAYEASATATGNPTFASVTGEVDAQLLGVILAGNSSSGYRSFAPPSAMLEQVDDRPPVSGGWNVLGMFTKALTSAAATGQQAATLLSTTSNLAAPAAGATATFASVGILVPSGGSGALAQAGSGALTLGPTKVDAAGTLARTGSGTLALTGKPVVGGTLSRDGSGQATLGGVARPAAALAQAGSGQAAFGPSAMFARATLAQTGLGSLTIAGGGGAGALAVNGSGSVAFGATPRPTQTLAVAGSGSVAFGQSRVTVGGLLARAGSGALTLVGKPAMFGTLARTGSGQLNLGRGAFTTALQAWDAAASTWKPVLVMARDAVAGLWRTAAGRRASRAISLPPAAGPIYSDGAGPAGVFSRPREFGPAGGRPAQMTRGPGGIGWGAYLVADLPNTELPIPAGTWIELTWWQRNDAAGGNDTWAVFSDDGLQRVTADAFPARTTEWTKRTFTTKTLAAWTPGVHRLRASLNAATGSWLEISDVSIRTWT